MPPEILQTLIAEAKENSWAFFPPQYFSREQIANWLQVDIKTLNARLRRTGVGTIPHWSGLLDIEVVASMLVMRCDADDSPE